MKKNVELRNIIKKNNLKNWQIADELKIQESMLSKILRYEISDTNKDKIMEAISSLISEEDKDNGRSI